MLRTSVRDSQNQNWNLICGFHKNKYKINIFLEWVTKGHHLVSTTRNFFGGFLSNVPIMHAYHMLLATKIELGSYVIDTIYIPSSC